MSGNDVVFRPEDLDGLTEEQVRILLELEKHTFQHEWRERNEYFNREEVRALAIKNLRSIASSMRRINNLTA